MSFQSYAPLLDRIYREHRSIHSIILHYDPEVRDLRAWFWPTAPSGQRITPTDLWEYRYTHDFKSPCCLCACNFGGTYTESAIYQALDGPYAGEFVCGCASRRCGYLIGIERMYSRRGLMVDRYPVRGSTAYCARPMASRHPAAPLLGETARIQSRPAALPAAINDIPLIATYERPVKAPDIILNQLMRLHSSDAPGLPEAEFRKLFAKCRCGLVMSRGVFGNHVCQPVIIDLTGDDNTDKLASIPIIIDLTGDSEDDM